MNALGRAHAFDQQITSDAGKVSLDYSELLSVSLRQAFAGSEITVAKNADGSFDKSDVLIFTKGSFLDSRILSMKLNRSPCRNIQ